MYLIRTENLLFCSRTALIRLYRNSSQCLIFKMLDYMSMLPALLALIQAMGSCFFLVIFLLWQYPSPPLGTPYNALYGKGPLKDGIFFRLQRYKRVTISRVEAGEHNPERATPILGLCHSVFTNWFIFRYICTHF